MRKEIEVKARLRDPEAVEEKLKELGCVFAEPKTQDDSIFVDANYGPFEQFKPKKNILRIRKMKDKTLFTLKQPQSNELDCIERETEIENPEEFQAALELMGYNRATEVHKVRRTTNYNNWEINIDEVQNVGTYIEVESIATDEHDAEDVQNELFAFLETLGVSRDDQELHGYDTLSYLAQRKS